MDLLKYCIIYASRKEVVGNYSAIKNGRLYNRIFCILDDKTKRGWKLYYSENEILAFVSFIINEINRKEVIVSNWADYEDDWPVSQLEGMEEIAYRIIKKDPMALDLVSDILELQ